MLGLPGESAADMLATADALAGLPLHAIKIHHLYVVKDTPLEALYQRGQIAILQRDEYVSLVCDFLERLNPEIVIHRLCGDAPPAFLVAPQWCLDKAAFLKAVDRELLRRDSWQGKSYREGISTRRAVIRRSLPLVSAATNQDVRAGASHPG